MTTTYRSKKIEHVEEGYQYGENIYSTMLQAMQAVDKDLQ